MRSTSGTFALVLGMLALCCGGPLLVGALLATGLGAWLLASSGFALGGAALLAFAAAVLWLGQRSWRFSGASETDCCAPTTTSRHAVKP